MSKALSPLESFRNNLTRMEGEFKKALPSQIPVERFTRVVMTAIQNNPKILDCVRLTLYNACMRAAQDGLLPDGREGAIVPFKDKAQWLPMVAGLTKKARQSGEIRSIDAQVVYSNDKYESWVDENGPHFKHSRVYKDRGEPILTYGYAITKDGFFFEEIDEQQMADIESVSRAKDGPWKGPFKDEMRRKSAIRRLAKYRLPSSTDLEETFQREDQAEIEAQEPQKAIEQPKTSGRLSQLLDEDEKEELLTPDFSCDFDGEVAK